MASTNRSRRATELLRLQVKNVRSCVNHYASEKCCSFLKIEPLALELSSLVPTQFSQIPKKWKTVRQECPLYPISWRSHASIEKFPLAPSCPYPYMNGPVGFIAINYLRGAPPCLKIQYRSGVPVDQPFGQLVKS